MLQVLFSGEGKLFGKSFLSPEPPSFPKLFKKQEKRYGKAGRIDPFPFVKVFPKSVGIVQFVGSHHDATVSWGLCLKNGRFVNRPYEFALFNLNDICNTPPFSESF